MPKSKEELEIEKKELEEKELEERAKKMAQIVKAELGLDDLKKGIIEEVHGLLKDKENQNVLKVFVEQDVEKAVNELTKEEKVKAFCYALYNFDEAAIKALSEGVNADGGYTVPDEFYGELLEEIKTLSTIRPECFTVTMKRKTLKLDEIINGPVTYWTGEGVTKTTTTAEFAQKTLTAFKLASIIYMTDELVEDSVYNLESVIINRFATNIIEKEEAAFLGGNGTTQPEGLFINSSIGTITCVGNLSFDQLIDLEYGIPKKFRSGSSYVVNGVNVKELRKLKDDGGRYIWSDGDIKSGRPDTLNGYPVIEHDEVPEGQILFGNLKKGYWIGDRQGMTVKVTGDTETTFTKDMQAIRVVKRVAGLVVFPQYFKKLTSIP